jgi:hypothetical protein
MENRAFEFLSEAYSLLAYWGNHEKARLLVRLALGEVEELQDRLALCNATDYELTRRIEARSVTTPGGVLVGNAQPLTPARLTESPRLATALEWGRRAALPGNGKGL